MAQHINPNCVLRLSNFLSTASRISYEDPFREDNFNPFNLEKLNSYCQNSSYGYVDSYINDLYKTKYIPYWILSAYLPSRETESYVSLFGSGLHVGLHLKRSLENISRVNIGVSALQADVETFLRTYRYSPSANWAKYNILFQYLRKGFSTIHPDQVITKTEEMIERAIALKNQYYTLFNNVGYRGTYLDVHRTLSSHQKILRKLYFKAGYVHVGYGILVDLERKKVLAALTIRPEFLEYFTLKIMKNGYNLSGESAKLNPRIFQFVIDEDFANHNTVYAKELFKVYKKGFIDVLPTEIEQVMVDGTSVFESIVGNKHIQSTPEELGPIEEIELNNNIQEHMFEDIQSKAVLDAASIKITV